MAVAIDKHSAAGVRGVHPDDLIGGGRAVSHHIALLSPESAGDILFRLQMRPSVIEQRSEFGDGDRNIRLQRVAAKKIIKQAADRAFLIRRAAHMAWRAERIFALFHIGKQRFGKGRRDVVEILLGVLANARRDVVGNAQRILEKPERHAHLVGADIQCRVRINKGIKRQIFVKLIDFAT